jgi:3-(3-hydroxy-phenyl)propionate hydroxylase
MKVGLVGLGRMGAAIAQRLKERGCEVAAWDRNSKAREAQAKRGLRIVSGPRAVADKAEVVLSIITEDKGVRQIFAGPDGFLSGEVNGKLFIEMSTLQPMTHRDLAPMVKARWELKILPHEKPEAFQDEARVREVLAGFVDIDAIEIWRSAVYRFHALVAAQWSCDRIFLLGDCAHQMPPFLGQGMCAGIRDAANLVWKLLLVEKAGVPPAVLRTYQDERKTHVQSVVAQAKELGLIIGELDVAAATKRDARLRAERTSGEPARHRLIPPLTRGLIDRADRGEPTRAAGSLFPQPQVETADGRITLMDDILPPAFLVVSSTMAAQAALCGRETAMLRRLGAVRVVLRSDTGEVETSDPDVITLTAKDELFANWLLENEATAAVVRPDRYVYGVAGAAADLARLIEHLAGALFGERPS